MPVSRLVFPLLFLLAARTGAQAPDSTSAALLAEGRKVFEGKSGGALCFSCHGMNAKGIPGVGPDLTDGKWLHADGTPASIEAVVAAGVPKPKQAGVAMPPMGGAKLSAGQLRAVAAYLSALNPPR